MLVLAFPLAAQTGNAARPSDPAEVTATTASARRLLEARMPVSASALLARELAAGEVRGDEIVLLAAQAFADQRAWVSVLGRLAGREGPPTATQSHAALLLARAYAGLDSLTRSAAHYRAYLDAVDGTPPLRARVEFARVSY
ncbi:MAG: hypothetical protein F4Z33_03705, partial [Gemmatimonadales bacterium]|nr:hypothetical protein [Gemmatimonadales bacterium]